MCGVRGARSPRDGRMARGPVLVRQLVGASGSVGSSVGRLYAINTLGEVAGAALSGFALIPALGVTRTIWVASALNFSVCAAGFAVHRRLGVLPAGSGEAGAGYEGAEPGHGALAHRTVILG